MKQKRGKAVYVYADSLLSIPLRMKLIIPELVWDMLTTVFQFLWGWNPGEHQIGKRIIISFQFLWGWNSTSGYNVFIMISLSIPLRMKRKGTWDRRPKKFNFQFLWGWNRNRGESSKTSQFIPFNSFEDETIRSQQRDFSTLLQLSIPLRMKR